MVTNNWSKFKLLMWKNWTVQRKHKLQFFFEIMIPPLFSCILVYLRTVVVPSETKLNTTFLYESIEGVERVVLYQSDDTAVPVQEWAIVYSPQNEYLQQIMEGVADKVFVNKKDLPFLGKIEIIPKNSSTAVQNYIFRKKPIAGVVFDQKLKNIKNFPKILTYSLRFPAELRHSSSIKTHSWETDNLFKYYERGPRCYSFPNYNEEGFIIIQNAIAMQYLTLLGESNLPSITLQCAPHPPFIQDDILFSLQHFSPLIVVLSFLYPVTQTVRYITLEKEKKIKEVMKIMGLANWLHWTAWFVKTYIILAISVAIIVIFLKIHWIPDANSSLIQYSDWSVILVFFLIYAVAITTFCFMVATFFSKANTAAAASGLIWFALFLPFIFTYAKYNSFTLSEKLLLCLLLNIGLSYGLKIILAYETSGVGLQWFNLFNESSVDDNLNVGFVMVMMLVVAAIQMLITLYFERIYPGDFGVPEKWYFPLTWKFWSSFIFCSRSNRDLRLNQESRSYVTLRPHQDSDFFEFEPIHKPAGIQINNLTKKFGKKKAVNKLSINMFAGEITVLLGHNGAGKTTTLSMLTGMFPPSSGTILVNGFDTKTQLVHARDSLGFCPQYDTLFDDLTVKEHIIFFSRLKGMKGHSVEREVQRYLKILDIKGKTNTLSKNLSGGMRRKLSVCTALCGDSKVVVLDEPSSGMDPAARRSLWNLIQAEKKDRTFLISTHFMDEADVLADRIAVLAGGELKCYGTTFYLKKKFGVGYHLICVKGPNCDPKTVTALLSPFIPTIKIESEIGSELTYLLPESFLPVFEKMFSKLEQHSNEVNLNGYGISITTLEEVFMLAGSEKQAPNDEKEKLMRNDSDSSVNILANKTPILVTNYRLLCYQWHAMILKKGLFLLRNFFLLGFQIIVPPVMVMLSIVVARVAFSLQQLKKLKFDLKVYKNTVTIIEKTDDSTASIVQGYKSYITSLGVTHNYEIIESDFASYFLNLAIKMLGIVNQKYFAAATLYPDKINVWYNTRALHSLPLSLNVAHNAILRSMKGSEYQINVANEPLPFSTATKLSKDPSETVIFQIILYTSFCFAFVTSSFMISIIKERVSRSQLIQLVSGIKVFIYWATHFIFDYVLFIIISIVTLLTLMCFQEDGYSDFDVICITFLLFLVFALAAIPFTYLMSKLFKDPAAGFLFLSIINIFTGLTFFILIAILKSIESTVTIGTNLHFVFLIFPHYAFSSGVFHIGLISAKTTYCLEFCDFNKVPDCNIDFICKKVEYCCPENYFSWHEDTILPNLIILLVSSAFYSTILLCLEYRSCDKLSYCFDCCIGKRKENKTQDNHLIDDDVIEEQKRVKYIVRNDVESENLVVHKVTKYFKNFTAVRHLSVGVQRGECFGLLGVNGAGKTTLFKMMVGDSNISFGKIYVQGVNIKTNIGEFYKRIGYCPQFDALLEDFTGKEVLKIFCLIRGIPKNKIHDVTVDMAQSFGYAQHLDKKIKYYSGGTKRKISTSIALLGGPVVIFLDEPTTGMDPGSRRQLWNVIIKLRDLGKSIILTSHSMEECEALCTRIAIMVNGEFQCIGSTQHLKNKFSKGLVLKIKIKSIEDTVAALLDVQVEVIKSFIQKEFPDSFLKERFQYLFTFYIPLTANVKWSKIFGVMESKKMELNIEDYSITQTTLEEIFLEFAVMQREDVRIRKKIKK